MILSAPEKALAGNPVVVTVSDIPNDTPLTLKVSAGLPAEHKPPLWTGIGLRNSESICTFDIADIVRELVASVRPSAEDLALKSFSASGFARYATVDVSIKIDDGEITAGASVQIFFGGITTELRRRIAAEGEDIFTKKYEALDANYALSTRTYSKVIVMEHRELAPIWFKSHGESIRIKDVTTGAEIGFTETSAGIGVSVLNLPKILRDAGRSHGAFAFYTHSDAGEVLSFYVVINKPRSVKESYLLDFRNSYGAYERIELTGRAVSEPEYAEPRSYSIYDRETGTLVNAADRRQRTDSIKASGGWRDGGDLMFFRDMLQSDDIRLLGPSGAWVKVLVEPDGDTVPLLQKEPISNNVIIKFADDEDYYLPDLYLGTNEEMPDVPVSIWSKGYWDASGWWLDESFWKN